MIHRLQKITIAFRYDDFSSISPKWLEIRLINTFKKYNIPCTFGIIPYTHVNIIDNSSQKLIPLSDEKAHILKNAIIAKTVEPALHGYSHQVNQNIKIKTEFSGLSKNIQIKKIAEGKTLLEKALKTRIITFIPPWNRYDKNTLQCLQKLNFNCISARLSRTLDKNSPLQFIPATSSINQLKSSLKIARFSLNSNPFIHVFFHPTDFLEIDNIRGQITYSNFSKLLHWITLQKDISISSMNQLIKKDDFGIKRFKKNRKYYLLGYRFLPHFIQNRFKFYSPLIYRS